MKTISSVNTVEAIIPSLHICFAQVCELLDRNIDVICAVTGCMFQVGELPEKDLDELERLCMDLSAVCIEAKHKAKELTKQKDQKTKPS